MEMEKGELTRQQEVRTMDRQRASEPRTCPVCGHRVRRGDMRYTRDCQGIPYRLVCWDCWAQLMAGGYDGEHYTEADECLDWDY